MKSTQQWVSTLLFNGKYSLKFHYSPVWKFDRRDRQADEEPAVERSSPLLF